MTILQHPAFGAPDTQTSSGGIQAWIEQPHDCASVSSEAVTPEVLDEDDFAYERAVDWSLKRLGARMARRRRQAA